MSTNEQARYTAVEVEAQAALYDCEFGDGDTRDMLRAYAATLRQSADSGRVGDEVKLPDPETMCAMWTTPTTPDAESIAFLAGARQMRAALEAALAAQGQGEQLPADLCDWLQKRDLLPDTGEDGCFDIADLITALNDHENALIATHPAPAASPAGVPDGYVLVPAEVSDGDAFMVYNTYQQPWRGRKDAYRIAIRNLAERAREMLAAQQAAR